MASEGDMATHKLKRRSRNSGKLKVLGSVSGWKENGQACFGLLIRFRTITGSAARLFLRRSELGHPARLWDRLVDAGFSDATVLPPQREQILANLRSAKPRVHFTAVDKLGWHGRQYVWSDGTVTGAGSRLLYQSSVDHVATASVRGTASSWRRKVARPARHSTPAIFAISLSFAAFLLRDAEEESGTFHLTSTESGAGKTLAQLLAQSVIRKASRAYLRHWDATDVACEELATEHNDSVLPLDEIARLASTPDDQAVKAAAASFRMAGGVSRLRSKHYIGTRNTQWRVLVLSSGETSISQIANLAGRKRLQGDSVRMIDVPAVRRKGRGIFDLLPENRSTGSVAKKLEAGIRNNYAVAGRRFVEKYLANRTANLKRMKSLCLEFMTACGVSPESWEQRFASRFALAYSAALLARQFDLVPWSRARIFLAISTVYQDARAAVQGSSVRVDDAVALIKGKLRSKTRLVDVRRGRHRGSSRKASKRAARYGFVRAGKDGHTEYLVRPSVLDRWAGGHTGLQLIVHALRNKGALLPDSTGINTTQVAIAGEKSRTRFYRIVRRRL